MEWDLATAYSGIFVLTILFILYYYSYHREKLTYESPDPSVVTQNSDSKGKRVAGICFLLIMVPLLAISLYREIQMRIKPLEADVWIQAKPENIFPYINAPKYWSQWQFKQKSWFEGSSFQVSDMKKIEFDSFEYPAPAEGVGASQVGRLRNGNTRLIKITSSELNRSVSYELSWSYGYVRKGKLILIRTETGTKVRHTYDLNQDGLRDGNEAINEMTSELYILQRLVKRNLRAQEMSK